MQFAYNPKKDNSTDNGMVLQQFRVAEIEIAKSPTDEKIIGIFRYEGGGQMKKGSTILILAEISSTLYAYERFLDVINATTEQARHLISAVETDPVARFEKLIQRINEDIVIFLEGEPTPLAWSRVNIFIIELSQDHVCLTGRGRLMNIFLQKQEDGGYRTFDLFGSLDQSAEVDPNKPFSSLICGDMKVGDILMAGTLNLERLRNELRIKERLTTLPPVSAALEIKQELEHRGIPDDFVAAIVACCALEMPSFEAKETPPPETDKSTTSINKLIETEKDTEETLSPAIAPTQKNTGVNPKKMVVGGFFGLVNILRRGLKKYRPKDVAVMTSLRGMNAGHGSIFTKKRKRIAIALVLVLLISLFGVYSWKKNRRLAAEAATWTAMYEQARDDRDRAESDLVYGNESRAKKSIDDAVGLLGTLDQSKPEYKEKIDNLNKELSDLNKRLQKITSIEPVELTALSGAANGTLAAPVLIGNSAYAVANDSHTIIKIDITDKTVKNIPLPSDAEPIVSGSAGDKSIIFTTAKGKLYAVDISNDAVKTFSSQPRSSDIADLVVYGGKTYELDKSDGQIWKAAAISGGFGAEQSYIKASNVELAGAVGLAIDSNVYVLKPDGTVARFLSGGQEGFSLTAIEPPLRAASAIWTDVDATNIVITDPAEKRVLIFNKDGTLKAQLQSDKFSGPRDVYGDQKTNKVLVVDGTSLLLIDLP
ncbi:hypothetical protein KKF59_04510 [Patescibacteria group bacterium]|nr:hypothetical protein [Patescibacteria group bacterium]MBU1908357.1 hypothetical protein [Patescibacteria group bacterium]